MAYTAILCDALMMHTKVIGFRWDLGDASRLDKPGQTFQSDPGFGGLLQLRKRHSPQALVVYTATLGDAKRQS